MSDNERILTEEELEKVAAGYEQSKLTPEEAETSDTLWAAYKKAACDCVAGIISREEFNAAAQTLARFIDKMDDKYGA